MIPLGTVIIYNTNDLVVSMMKMKNKKIFAAIIAIVICIAALSCALTFGTETVSADETELVQSDMRKGAGLADELLGENSEDNNTSIDTDSTENSSEDSEEIEDSDTDQFMRSFSLESTNNSLMTTASAASVNITKDFCSIKVGSSKKLEYKQNTSGKLTWHTTDSSVCTVSSNGTVTAKTKGFAIVYAMHEDGTYDYCKIYAGYYIGADISSYQPNVNWDTLKASGLDFAILRAGYGNDASTQTDVVFNKYYEEAQRVGIPLGVYWFNYTESVKDANNEAAAFWSVVGDKEFQIGYWADYEHDSREYYKKMFGSYPNSSLMTNMVTTFLSDVKNRAGEYSPVGYYSSMSPLGEWFEANLKDTWPLWGAFYISRTDDWWEDGYKGNDISTLLSEVLPIPTWYAANTYNMTMLQYTCAEKCEKIGQSGGGLDMDIIPMDSPMALRFITAKADSAVSNSDNITVSWQKPEDAEYVDGYVIFRKQSGGEWEEIGTVESSYTDENGNAVNENTGYTFEDKTAENMKEYYYTVRAYAMSGSEKIYSLCDEDGVYCQAIFNGDVNMDGKIDAVDYVLIRNHVKKKNLLTSVDSIKMSDYNGDGNLDESDYEDLKTYIMSK